MDVKPTPSRWKGFSCLLAGLFLLAAGPAAAQSSRLFPPVPAFELPLASPRVNGFAGRLLGVSRGDSRFGAGREAEAAVGEDFPVIALRRGPRPVSLGFGVEAYGRFDLSDPKSALVSNDWVVGLNVDARLAPWELTLRAYHESSHLGDEYAETFNLTRIDWTREVLEGWVRRQLGPFQLAAALSYVPIHKLPVSPWGASAALDYQGTGWLAGGQRIRPLAGLFTEVWSETSWKPSSSAKLGLGFPGAHGRELRVSLIAHDGLSTQRQFFRARSRYVGLELEFQL